LDKVARQRNLVVPGKWTGPSALFTIYHQLNTELLSLIPLPVRTHVSAPHLCVVDHVDALVHDVARVLAQEREDVLHGGLEGQAAQPDAVLLRARGDELLGEHHGGLQRAVAEGQGAGELRDEPVELPVHAINHLGGRPRVHAAIQHLHRERQESQ
jgi:hypothetical protein